LDIYRERAYLTAFLSKVYPSRLSYSDPNEPDWAVLYVESPEGQLSWHISPNDMDLFSHLAIVPGVKWDGHTTDEKYERLGKLNGQG
jgi:hypothetical protein